MDGKFKRGLEVFHLIQLQELCFLDTLARAT
jgi:hypothetical protein